MNDRERLIALLTEWGVGFNGQNAEGNRHGDIDAETAVILCEGDDKIGGYADFFAVFQFDADGRFQRVEVWE